MPRLLITTENAEYQIIKSLKQNRVKRNKSHEIFIEGIECIKQAIRSNVEVTRIIINKEIILSNWGKSVIKQCENAKLIELSKHLYNELAEKANPSEMLITAKIKPCKIEDITMKNPFIVVFDRPSDYGNFGSLVRSANAFNVDGIFIVGHGIDIYEPKVIRASLGSVFFMKIIAIESIEKLIEYIKNQKVKNNMEIIGTDSTGTVSLENSTLKRPIMIIMGNEAKGMSVKLKELCDKIIKIPMEGNINSLNVSCAASIIMWEIYKGGGYEKR
jgi:TrmH family RNA methyltransferase